MNVLYSDQHSLDSKISDLFDDDSNPNEDAEKLYRTLKGISVFTNQKIIIDIITNRSNIQRQKLKSVYLKLFNRNLVNDLCDSSGENIKQTVYALMLPPADLNAFIFKNALNSLTLKNLVESFVTLSNLEIIQAKNAYQRLFESNLESDIKTHTDENPITQKFLRYLATGIRPIHELVDRNLAQKDLIDIFGNSELWFDESRFILVLCSRSHVQLNAMFDEYKSISGHSFEEKIKKELSNNALLLECVLVFTECIRDKQTYFAKILFNSQNVEKMKIIVSRCEKDLSIIKEKFKNIYNINLSDHLKKNANGNYQTILLNLIGGDD